MLKVVIPTYGDQRENFPRLKESIDNQAVDCNVSKYFAEDIIDPEFRNILKKEVGDDFVPNKSKKRLYALKNVCRVLDSFDDEDCIVGIVDGDDYLWGNDCFQNIIDQYSAGFDCVWTQNDWEGFNLSHSGPINDEIDVYAHPWSSSHFKTFRLSTYRSIKKSNFKNEDGDWFEACYDQALMLPIIHKVHLDGGKTKFIDKIHYIYRGDIKQESEFRKKQLEYESFIRTRGYLK